MCLDPKELEFKRLHSLPDGVLVLEFIILMVRGLEYYESVMGRNRLLLLNECARRFLKQWKETHEEEFEALTERSK